MPKYDEFLSQYSEKLQGLIMGSISSANDSSGIGCAKLTEYAIHLDAGDLTFVGNIADLGRPEFRNYLEALVIGGTEFKELEGERQILLDRLASKGVDVRNVKQTPLNEEFLPPKLGEEYKWRTLVAGEGQSPSHRNR